MKILGIVCSPRRRGNTEILMQEALESAREAGAEVEMVTVAGKTIQPCDGCDSCLRTAKCHIDDDMQEIYPKMLEADGIFFGSPVYFWSVTAQAKALIDRTHVFGPRRNLRGKVAGILVVTRRAAAANAFSLFSAFINLQRMVLVGGAIAFGGGRGEVTLDKQGMTEARLAGRAMVRMIKAYRSPNA